MIRFINIDPTLTLKIYEIKSNDSLIWDKVKSVISLKYVIENAKAELAARVKADYGERDLYSLLFSTLIQGYTTIWIKYGNMLFYPDINPYDEEESVTEEDKLYDNLHFNDDNLINVSDDIINYIAEKVLNKETFDLIDKSTIGECKDLFWNFDAKYEEWKNKREKYYGK